ncbi:hypothetical protein V1519DRAFT_298423 [Lipomyces tetrasporus]
MSQSANINYIPGQPHQRYQSHQLQQHTVMTPHQNGTQISPGLVRRNQSVPPEVQYAGGVAPANQSQLVYAVSHDPPKMYQSTQSATNPQSIVFAQVPDPQMFSPQTGSQSPSPFRDSSQQQQQHQQQRLQVQQIRDQRQHEQHQLGAAVQPIPHLQGNEGVLEKNGPAQRHRQRSPAVTGSELTAATTTGRSSATACGQTLGASMSIVREPIASLSSATLNVVGKQQHLNNSPITISPVDMPAAVSEKNRDPPMDNGPSSAQLWTTPMNFVSESSSGERGPPVNNLSAAAVDRPEQTAAPSVMTDNLAQSSKSTIAPGASPTKSSAKRVRKAPATQTTKPSKRLANKQAHGSQRLSEATTSTSNTADNENPTMKVQQLHNRESNIAVSPEESSRVQSQKPAVQNDALSASMLSAYITSRSGAAEVSSESQDASPGDYLVWARKLAYQATDAKKRFDSLTERLSMDEGKWGDLMQKHTTSVRKAVSELKRDVRDRATQYKSTEQIQAVCISVKEYVAVAEERMARLDAAVMGLTSNIAELTSTVTNVMVEMSNGYRVASTQQESQMPKVAPTDTIDSSSPRGLKRARQQDHTQFPASKGISLPVRRTSEPLDRDNVRNDTLAEEKESPILRVQSEPIPNNEDDIAASIIGDDEFVPHYTIDTRRKLTSSSHPPSESFDEGFEIKPEVIGAVKPLRGSRMMEE